MAAWFAPALQLSSEFSALHTLEPASSATADRTDGIRRKGSGFFMAQERWDYHSRDEVLLDYSTCIINRI